MCVPRRDTITLLYMGVKRCRVEKCTAVWVWPCEAIGRILNY